MIAIAINNLKQINVEVAFQFFRCWQLIIPYLMYNINSKNLFLNSYIIFTKHAIYSLPPPEVVPFNR